MTNILAREKLLDWAKLWDDFTQKELLGESIIEGQQKGGDEKNLALARKAKKGKGKSKQNHDEGASSQKQKDTNKVKCFACH